MELIGLLSFAVGVAVLIVFFVMASNIAKIRDNTQRTDYHLRGIQSSLDRIVKSLEDKKDEVTR